MNFSLTQYLCDPYDKSQLQLHAFNVESGIINSGVFFNEVNSNIYPIVEGVPIFIKNRIPQAFYEQYRSELDQILSKNIHQQILKEPITFSFSEEWKEAHIDNMDTVWGQSVESRLQQHFTDTCTDKAYYLDKMVVDIGCGNGILTHELSKLGATLFGIDYSNSVWNAHARHKHPQLCYLQCDLHHLPFQEQFFDLLYSNGVLHHTPNTYRAFQSIINSIKSNGKCYIWLYSRGKKLGFNMFLYATDALRFVVNKLNTRYQKRIIEKLLTWKIRYNRRRGKTIPPIIEAKIDLYDILTPTYKFYHTESEVAEWFKKNDFSKAQTTHINPYGFGMLATKY